MPSDLLAWEEHILAQLAPVVEAGYAVEPFLDQLGRPQGRGQIVVAYKQTTAATPQGKTIQQTQFTQSEVLTFELVIQVCNLRTHREAYPLLNQVRDLLTGTAPTELDRPLFMNRQENLLHDQGIWTFVQTYTTTLYYIKRGF